MARAGRPKQKKRPSKDADWEARLRESEARFRSLTKLSSDWYWEQDAEFRFTRIEGRYLDDDESLRAGFIGRHRWESGSPSRAAGKRIARCSTRGCPSAMRCCGCRWRMGASVMSA